MQSGGREDYLRLKEEYLRLRKDYLCLNEEYLCIKEEYLRLRVKYLRQIIVFPYASIFFITSITLPSRFITTPTTLFPKGKGAACPIIDSALFLSA